MRKEDTNTPEQNVICSVERIIKPVIRKAQKTGHLGNNLKADIAFTLIDHGFIAPKIIELKVGEGNPNLLCAIFEVVHSKNPHAWPISVSVGNVYPKTKQEARHEGT